jgi:hypothetical protein
MHVTFHRLSWYYSLVYWLTDCLYQQTHVTEIRISIFYTRDPFIGVIQGDQKSVCIWWLQYRKLQVTFKVYSASLQTFIDTPNCVLEDRVQYSTVHIPNVFCDGRLQIISCVGIAGIHWVFVCFCNVIIRCTGLFDHPVCSFVVKST